MFEWMQGNAYTMLVTVYPSNITLNNAAAMKFKDVRWVLIGFDDRNNRMAIKGISKEELDLNIVPKENLHKISIGKGYGRISNKTIVEQMKKRAHFDLENTKIVATYDEKEKMLIIDLNSRG